MREHDPEMYADPDEFPDHEVRDCPGCGYPANECRCCPLCEDPWCGGECAEEDLT